MRFPLSNQFHQSLLLHLCQQAHVQVPVRLDPVLVRLDRKGSDEAQATFLVREYPDDLGPPFDLFIEPFQHVGRLQMLVMPERKSVEIIDEFLVIYFNKRMLLYI